MSGQQGGQWSRTPSSQTDAMRQFKLLVESQDATKEDVEDSLASEVLRYGGYITLFDAANSGFVEGSISSTAFSGLTMFKGNSHHPVTGDILMCVYQMVPHRKYKSHKRLHAAVQAQAEFLRENASRKKMGKKRIAELARASSTKLRALAEQALAKGGRKLTNEEFVALKAKHVEDIETLRKLARAEEEDNQHELQRKQGHVVSYGDKVQLKHLFTQQYIVVDGTKTSDLEPSHLRVYLSKETSRHSWFRIMPRYKVRNEGEEVRMMDQIVLENIKLAGQFLHTSSIPVPEHSPYNKTHKPELGQAIHEVNLSVHQTAYALRPFRQPAEEDEAKLKGGDVVRLFHKERGAYLAAEAMFCEGDQLRKDAHMRVRVPNPRKPHSMHPPTTAVTYWQVEDAAYSGNGSIITWGSSVRLRHITSQRYLQLMNRGFEYPLGLANGEADPSSSAFILHPVIREEEEVFMESYARIQHRDTRNWLHVDEEDEFQNPGFEDTAFAEDHAGLALKWDGAKLLQIQSQQRRRFDDAFVIQKVEPSLVQEVHYVIGMVPVFQYYVRLRSQRELTSREVEPVLQSLKELRAFLRVKGEVVKTRQKILRNLGVMDLGVAALRAVLKTHNPKAGYTLQELKRKYNSRRVVDSLYELMADFLAGEAHKNELYLARHLPFFLRQIGGGLQVEKMIAELIGDNRDLMAAITEREMSVFLRQLESEKDPDYLEVLSVFCECQDVAETAKQTFILRGLFNPDGTPKPILLRLKFEGHDVLLMDTGNTMRQVSHEAGRLWDANSHCPVALRPGGSTIKNNMIELFEFLYYQLLLYSRLCYGRNEEAIRVIRQNVTVEEALTCIQIEEMPNCLREAYIDILLHVFIASGDVKDCMDDVVFTFGWEQLRPEVYDKFMNLEDNTSYSGARVPFMRQLQDWIVKFLDQNKKMVASQMERTRLIDKVLELVQKLIDFGFYMSRNLIKPLAAVLWELLDPTTNRQKPEVQLAEMSAAELKRWNRVRKEKSKETHRLVGVTRRGLEILSSLSDIMSTYRVVKLASDFRHLKLQLDSGAMPRDRALTMGQSLMIRRRASIHSPTKSAMGGSSSFVLALGDLLDEGVDALQFTDRAREYIAEICRNTNVVMDPGWRSDWSTHMFLGQDDLECTGKHKAVCNVETLLDLAEYNYDEVLIDAFELLDRLYTTQQDMFDNAKKIFIVKTPQSVEVDRKCVHEWGPALQNQLLTHDTDKLVATLHEMTSACRDGESSAPHPANQKIILAIGVIPLLVDMLESRDKLPLNALVAALGFMKALCCKFSEAQNELFVFLPVILSVTHEKDGWQDELAKLIAGIFDGNASACKTVSKEVLLQIVALVATHTTKMPSMLMTLAAVTKLSLLNLPIKRNQSLIMKFLLQNRDSIVRAGLMGAPDDSGRQKWQAEREAVLRAKYRPSAQFADEARKQDFHVNLVSLIASCCEGTNRFIESMAQAMLSVNDILDVLENPRISTTHKGSYMRYLNWAYLFTTQPARDPALSKLKEKDFWVTLKQVFVDIVGTPSREDYFELAFEAFLPLLHSALRLHGDQPGSAAPIHEIIDNLQTFVDAHIDHFSQIRAQHLVDLMLDLRKKTGAGVMDPLLARVRARVNAHDTDMHMGDLGRDYMQAYQGQMRLNESFQIFAENLRVAYRGKNTVSKQLPWHKGSGHPDVVRDAYSEEETADEALPLGPEFQAHVDLFLKYKKFDSSFVSDKFEAIGVRDGPLHALISSLRASQEYGLSRSARLKDDQDKHGVRALQIVRAIIHNPMKLDPDFNGGLSSEERTVARPWQEFQDRVVKNQGVLVLSELLGYPNDDVVREALAALTVILAEANVDAQAQFENHFLNTREETFFINVRKRMIRARESRNESRALRKALSQKKEDQSIMIQRLKVELDEIFPQFAEEADDNNEQALVRSGTFAVLARPMDNLRMRRMTQSHKDRPSDYEQRRYQLKTKELFAVKDEGNIELVLRVMQLMCEGHNSVLQNYLRDQPDNVHQINLIDMTAQLLPLLAHTFNRDNLELITQTLDTTNEFASGNSTNCRCIFKPAVIDAVNSVIRQSSVPNVPTKRLAKLHKSATNLLLSLVELSDDESKQFLSELEGMVDMHAAHERMEFYLDLYKTCHDNGTDFWFQAEYEDELKDFEEEISPLDVAYSFFALMKKFKEAGSREKYEDYGDLSSDDGEDDDEDSSSDSGSDESDSEDEDEGEETLFGPKKVTPPYKDLERRSCSVEIVKDGKIHRFHFVNKFKELLRSEVKAQLIAEVDRSSPSEKLTDFLERAGTIIDDIDYLRGVLEWSPVSRLLIQSRNMLGNGLLWLTLLINIFMLATWRAPRDWAEVQPEFRVSWYNAAIGVSGAVHVLLCVLVAAAYYLVHPPSLRAFFKQWLSESSYRRTTKRLFGKRKNDASLHSITSASSLHHVLLVVFSILGLFTDGYFFCYHLLHIVVNNDILLRVIQSVTKNYKSLLWVAALMLIVIYIYSIVAFAFLRESFDNTDGAFCEDAFQCFVTSLRLGLMSGGGLGEALPPLSYSFGEPGLRTVFDLSFFIIITVVGLNVVFGIIVDTFSELRDEKYQIEESMQTECFICSLPAADFDRSGNGFDHHIGDEHNMWNYVYFLMHLKHKTATEYTSLEDHVYKLRQVSQSDISWLPMNHALSLNAAADEDQHWRNALRVDIAGINARLDTALEAQAQAQATRSVDKRNVSVQGQDGGAHDA